MRGEYDPDYWPKPSFVMPSIAEANAVAAELDVGLRLLSSRNPDAIDPRGAPERPPTRDQMMKVMKQIAIELDHQGYASVGRTLACPHPCIQPGEDFYLNMRLDFCDGCMKIMFPKRTKNRD